MSYRDNETFIEAPKKIYERAKAEGRLIEGKLRKELKHIALRQEGTVRTQFGSIAVDSEPMSRCAPKTKNSIDHPFGEDEERLAHQAMEVLSNEMLVSADAVVGDGSGGVTVRFIVPERHAHIAYGLRLLFAEPNGGVVEKPTYTIVFFTDDAFELNKKTIDVREKDATIRLWMGQRRGEQIKICRNSSYMGEGKKGVFQFEDWRVKSIDEEGIFLHAGARRDYLWVFDYRRKRPELKEIVTAVAGLTATGKTTTLCRKLARLPEERSEMIGDDGGTFWFDGGFSNFEGNGLYIKTEELEEHNQPEIYKAAVSPETILENVNLGRYPYIMPNFHDVSRTRNGRAMIARENLDIASQDLRVDKVDYIILLTRNPLINVVSRLTPEQATMQFIYGESIETSGGNPVEAGKFRRVFFLDPFAVGDGVEHAMAFYEFLKRNPGVKCYLANSGSIGQEGIGITLRDSLSAYNDLLRGQIKFSTRPDMMGYRYPIQCDRANLDMLRAEPMFPDGKLLEEKVKDFLRGRREYLEEIEADGNRIPANIRDSLGRM